MTSSLSPWSCPLLRYATAHREAFLSETARRTSCSPVLSCPTWDTFRAPLVDLLPTLPPLTSGCNRPLELTFAEQIHSLVYFHVEEYQSGRALLEDLADPQQTPPSGLPSGGIKRSTFFEALNSRGLAQMVALFQRLSHKAAKRVTQRYTDLGDLRAVDGTLVNATLSMRWADYTAPTPKAKVHLGFDLNAGIPC